MPFFQVKEHGVTLNGAAIQMGDVIELSEKSGQALVDEGKAAPADATEESRAALDANQEVTTPQGAPTGGTTANPDAGAAAAERQRLYEAVDAKYNREEGGKKPGLVEAAQAAGVEFPYDATKEEIINAVLDSGKAASFL